MCILPRVVYTVCAHAVDAGMECCASNTFEKTARTIGSAFIPPWLRGPLGLTQTQPKCDLRVDYRLALNFCPTCRATLGQHGELTEAVVLNYWAYKNQLGLSGPILPDQRLAKALFGSAINVDGEKARLETILLAGELHMWDKPDVFMQSTAFRLAKIMNPRGPINWMQYLEEIRTATLVNFRRAFPDNDPGCPAPWSDGVIAHLGLPSRKGKEKATDSTAQVRLPHPLAPLSKWQDFERARQASIEQQHLNNRMTSSGGGPSRLPLGHFREYMSSTESLPALPAPAAPRSPASASTGYLSDFSDSSALVTRPRPVLVPRDGELERVNSIRSIQAVIDTLPDVTDSSNTGDNVGSAESGSYRPSDFKEYDSEKDSTEQWVRQVDITDREQNIPWAAAPAHVKSAAAAAAAAATDDDGFEDVPLTPPAPVIEGLPHVGRVSSAADNDHSEDDSPRSWAPGPDILTIRSLNDALLAGQGSPGANDGDISSSSTDSERNMQRSWAPGPDVSIQHISARNDSPEASGSEDSLVDAAVERISQVIVDQLTAALASYQPVLVTNEQTLNSARSDNEGRSANITTAVTTRELSTPSLTEGSSPPDSPDSMVLFLPDSWPAEPHAEDTDDEGFMRHRATFERYLDHWDARRTQPSPEPADTPDYLWNPDILDYLWNPDILGWMPGPPLAEAEADAEAEEGEDSEGEDSEGWESDAQRSPSPDMPPFHPCLHHPVGSPSYRLELPPNRSESSPNWLQSPPRYTDTATHRPPSAHSNASSMPDFDGNHEGGRSVSNETHRQPSLHMGSAPHHPAYSGAFSLPGTSTSIPQYDGANDGPPPTSTPSAAPVPSPILTNPRVPIPPYIGPDRLAPLRLAPVHTNNLPSPPPSVCTVPITTPLPLHPSTGLPTGPQAAFLRSTSAEVQAQHRSAIASGEVPLSVQPNTGSSTVNANVTHGARRRSVVGAILPFREGVDDWHGPRSAPPFPTRAARGFEELVARPLCFCREMRLLWCRCPSPLDPVEPVVWL